MKWIAFMFLLSLIFSNPRVHIDFGHKVGAHEWRVITDRVMGGRSLGSATVQKNAVLVKGEVSLKNNGGFVSFRSPLGALDLSNYRQVVIRLRNKGKRFALKLSLDRRYFIPYFKHSLDTKEDTWQVIRLDLADFKQYQLGNPTGKTFTDEYKSEIVRVGLITDEKEEGSFELEVDYIKFE